MTTTKFSQVPQERAPAFESPVLPRSFLSSHRPSHLEVVGRVPRYPAGAAQAKLSAVVVPTSRPLAQSRLGLELAARCAEVRNAQFVVIRSGPATRDRFPSELAARTAVPTIVIDLPQGFSGYLSEFRNIFHPVANRYRQSDLAQKRNLALLLGLLAGWETVLLLDDDITTRRASLQPRRPQPLPAELVLRLDDVFAEFRYNQNLLAAGYLQKDFDDNSVVCHVRKLAGLPQEGFISGGAMVIRCTETIPFFPAAYNEDWLFLFVVMMQDLHRCPSSGVKRIGAIHQAAYYPFAAPRARGEEFGDVFAEGLYNLLEFSADDIDRQARSPEYWKQVIHDRKSMISHLIVQFQDRYGPTDHPVVNDVESCLRTALAVYPSTLAESAELMVSYFRALMGDLPTWYGYTERLVSKHGRELPLLGAIATLGIDARLYEIPSEGPQWLPQPRQGVAS